MRSRYKLNIIALKHDNKTTTDIDADTLLHENDVMVGVGKKSDIDTFQQYLMKGHKG